MDDDMDFDEGVGDNPGGGVVVIAEGGDDLASTEIVLSDLVQWNFSVTVGETRPVDAITSWYSNLPSVRLDLVGELGDSRGLFIIHGESLISHILSSHLPRFQTDLCFLSAVYYFERYLSIFVRAKGGNPVTSFKIVFFDCCKFRIENESELLLREILISHLTRNLPQSVVHRFADYTCEDFQEFIKNTDISSFIVSDLVGEVSEHAENDDDVNLMIQQMYLALSLSLVTVSRVRITWLDQLEQRGQRVVAMSVGPERRHEQVNQIVVESLQPVFEAAREDEDFPIDSGSNNPLISAIQKTLADLEDVSSAEAQIPIVVLKTILISSHLQNLLSIDDRAHATVDSWELFDTDGFVLQIWSQVATHLALLAPNHDDMTDVFDGRLLRTVFYCLWSAGAFASHKPPIDAKEILGIISSTEIEDQWSCICSNIPNISKSSVFSLQLPIDIPAPEKPSTPSQRAHRVPEFVNLGSFPLIDRATAVASVDAAGHSVAQKLQQVHMVPPPTVSGSKPGTYIPETQLVTRRFEEKRKRDYEEQKLKWKHLSIDKLAGRMRNWELRGAQKELRAMHQYAKSLVGADCLHHPIALVQDTSRKGSSKPAAPPQVAVAAEIIEEVAATTTTSSAGPKLSKKAQEIIAKNMAAQQKVQANKDSDQIKPLLERAEAIAEVRDFKSLETALFDICAGYSRILDSFDGFKGITSSVKLEPSQVKVIVAVLKSVKTALRKLIPSASSHMATDAARYGARNACAKVVRLCCSFVQEYATEIDGKEISRVQELLISLGFTHTSKNLFALWKGRKSPEESSLPETPTEDKKSSSKKKDKKESKTKESSATKTDDLDEFYVKSSKVEELIDITGGDEFLFQLVHLNSELDRPAGTLRDKRVMFKPDYWQRELLDIVDRNESALVCAPTASGKTFICYYAMEKILRTSNDKVAVYVAPSKALMNQVDAEIYARFRSKTYPATEHFHLSGDLEKDYQHNPFNCQVLVTIPSMLEQLLLDPTMQEWVQRIEYVIFDEVHSMGESAEEAAIWEHALQLIQCPFLAMSATVGNPSKFHEWLSYTAELKSGPKVHLIEYKERFNDLQKYAFAPDDSAILSIHPFTVLSYEDVLSGVIPPDLTMTPGEVGLLVSVMKRALVEANESNEDIAKKLSPRKVFEKLIPIDSMVTKRQFREYEKFILSEFIRLNELGILTRSVFEKIQAQLSLSPKIGDPKSMNDLWSMIVSKSSSKLSSGGIGGTTKTAIDIHKAIPALAETHYLDPAWLCSFLNQLDSSSLLPGIIFNLDRAEIMKMTERLADYLKKGQYEKYYGTEERAYATRAINKKRMDAYEAQIARRRMMERKNKKDEDFDEAEITEGIPLPVLVEDEFDAEFSFAGVKALSDPECHELIDKLAENKRIKPWIIEGLRRGIGMHHEGCSTRLKKTVEILFRRGFLRVVVATGTLSLGINMPCKSTVFVGTHVKLNALNYRQMAGRAGRRGFDLLGHVIFVDSTQKNIRRLLTSELTHLGGDFALSPSHILRAQIMLDHVMQHNKQQSNVSVDKIEKHLMAMLMGSFMPFNVNASANSLVVIRSTIDFLVREGLLTAAGQVTRLGSLAAFLFKREPENFIVSRILLSRDLLAQVEDWLKNEQTDQPSSMATFKLMQVLSSFCFIRPQIRGAAKRVIPPRKRHQPTESCPVLPNPSLFLPDSLCEIPAQFNKRVLDSVVNRLLVYMNATGASTCATLPVTGKTVSEKKSSLVDTGSNFSKILSHQQIRGVQIRSKLSTIAGKSDHFTNADDLVMSCLQRDDLLLDHASVPSLHTGAISSYACDFLLHGKLSLLQTDCLMGVSESWKEIDEWRFFLESLNIALEYMFELDNSHEYSHLQKVVKDLTMELSTKLQLEGA